jgi:protein-tyrosine phosphatase
VALDTAVQMSDEELEAVTVAGNGRDLLIETPYGQLPTVFERLIESLSKRGFRITLAHPELNPTLQREPERLAGLVRSGVVVQMTCASLSGRRSPQRKLGALALRSGWVTVLASDAHSAEWRPPDLGPGVAAARKILPGGEAEVEWMVNAAPLAIVQGRDIPDRPERRPVQGGGLFRRNR